MKIVMEVVMIIKDHIHQTGKKSVRGAVKLMVRRGARKSVVTLLSFHFVTPIRVA